MLKTLLRSRLSRWLSATGLGLLATTSAQAQLTGPKTIPGSYATLAAAVADLNTQGVGAGGVTFSVAAGYTETGNLLLTATGTAANPIVFQKAGAGANPVLSAGVGTTTGLDAIIGLSGSDYVTFDGIDVAESAANATATTRAEFGYALFRASATDGCQHNLIRNCVVTLDKTNTATIGIAGLASTSAATASVVATSAAGGNSNNLAYSNVVTNALTGINFAAASATTTANYDQNNQVGLTPTGAAAGNTVGNFGGTSSGWGIGGSYQAGLKISNNTINSTLNYTSATASTAVAASTVTSTLRGIFGNVGTSASIDIVNNTITLASGGTTSLMAGIENTIGSTAAGNTVAITGNTVTNCTYATATSGTFTGISNTAQAATVNLSNNSITNNTLPGTGTLLGITGGSPVALTISGNTVSGNAKSGTIASGTLYGIQASTSVITLSNNTITDNSIVAAGTGTGTQYGYYNVGSPTAETITGNTITNLSISGAGTSTTHVLQGIRLLTISGDVQVVTGNTIGSLAISGSGSGSVAGIQFASGGAVGSNIARNKIYDLSVVGAAGLASGITVTGGNTYPINNNLIGNLTAPAATGLNAVAGLNITNGTAVNAYFNTIYLNASSTGATFGTSGIYLGSTTVALDLRNNIVVNNSTAAGTGGATAALRRISGTAGTIPANLSGLSNNNLYYAGAPSATNLIYVEGVTATQTNAQQTLAAYKNFLLTREGNSVTETATPFASTTGPAANFLHLTPGAATQAESAGQAIAGITTDYDGDTRNATTPDIGADEGSFLLLDQTGPAITITALGGSAGSTVSRTLTVSITDVSGVATGANAPRLYFRKGGSGAFVLAAAPTVAGSAYTFTFDYALLGGVAVGDNIQYYVAAQDALGNLSTNPGGGAGATPPGTTPPALFYGFTIQGTISGTYYVSATAATSPVPARTYATLTAAVSAYNTSSLGGAVTFLLLDPTYSTGETFPIAILNNADASATNTLTIKPSNASGTTAFAITGSTTTAILQLLASDYVTLDGSLGNTISATDLRPSRDLTISNTNAGATSIVVQQFTQFTNDGATFNTIKNLTAVGATTATTAATLYGITLQAASNATTANQYTNNTVQNCAVRGTQVGILSSGGAIGLKSQNAVITQNDLNTIGAGALTRGGILSSFDNGIQITQNNIDGISFAGIGDVVGISLGFGLNYSNSTFTGSEVTNALVSRNYLGSVRQTATYSAAGIGLASATSGTNIIANNTVAGVSSNGTSPDYGAGVVLGGGAGSTTRFLYNSVSMTGTQTGGDQASFALVVGGSSPTVEIRNNILLNTQSTGGNSVALGLAYSGTAGNYAGLTSSNNAFFVGTGATFAVGQTGSLGTTGTLRATLADLNAETGQDRPTTATGPVGTSLALAGSPFVSATDLHVLATSASGLALNGAATPLADVTVDFDGETRSTTRPDIGADEFLTNLDVAVVALLSPVPANSCFGSSEAVTVSIRNASTVALDFALTPVTVTVTITPPGMGATPVTFTSTVSTGTLAANATQTVTLTGTADLSAAGAYAVTVTASLAGDDNLANNTLTPALTITNAPRLASFTYAGATGTICAGSATTLTPTLGTGSTAGTFSSTTGLTISAAGVINPATSTAGTYVVTNTVAAANGCPVTTATQSVTIAPGTTATFSYAGSPFCRTAATAVTPTITGTAGGTFTVAPATGLTINATTGAITPSTSTAGTYVVTYTVTGTCGSTATQTVVITNAPTAAFTYPTATICAGQTATVAPTLGMGASSGVFSSTTGLTINATTGVITPSTSTAGTYTVTNTVAASGTCAAVSATASVTVSPATTATFSYAGSPFCRTATTAVAPTITGTAGGTFTVAPATGLTISATTGAITPSTSTAGTYVVTYTVAGTCGSTATQSVTINNAPTAAFTFPTATICAGQAATLTPTLGTGSTAGTFSSTTGLTISAAGVINPATSTAGTYVVTNTVAAAGGCAAVTSTQSVTILPVAVATFNYGATSTFCASGTNPTLTLGTGATAGTFTVAPATGLTISATTGAITLASSTPGTYTVTNTVAASGTACGSTATTTVTITAAPTAAFTYANATICAGSATTLTPTLGTGSTAGTFSSTTGLTISAAGVINPATSTDGTYVVTNTVAAAGGCAAVTTTQSVTIAPRPATPTLTVVYNGPNTTLTSSAATGNQFFLNGTAVAGATGSTYTVTGQAAQFGAYTVVTTNAQGCASLPSTAITITAARNVLAGATLRAFPNPSPASGALTLELSGYAKAATLTVLNALGQVVSTAELPAGGTAARTLPVLLPAASGVYLLQVHTADGLRTVRVTRP